MNKRPIACQRELFDIPADYSYLNCAAMSPHSRRQVDAGCVDLRRRLRPSSFDPGSQLEEPEPLRCAFAKLINARPDDIALVAATSYGMATAAANLPISPNQKILVLEDQFPSNFHIWHRLAEDVGAQCVVIPNPTDGDWTTRVLDAIDDRVAIAALAPLHWLDGCKLDLKRIGDAVRAAGGALAVDATQAAGVMPMDVQELKPDFLVASCYKWLMGPYGIALMYVAPKYHERGRSLELSWLHGPRQIDLKGMMTHPLARIEGARKFDVGQRTHLASLAIATMGIEQLLAWDPALIQQTIAGMNNQILESLEATGFDPWPAQHRCSHYLCLRHEGGIPPTLQERLIAANVFVSIYLDVLRITPHVYNDTADIARLIEVLSAS